jgi:Family of unknown function (DUF6600)/FecR protein
MMTKTRTGSTLAVLATAILLLLPNLPSARAQDDGQDPPTRAGRIGYTQGSVSFQPNGEGDWLDAVPNRPLTTGDNLWADRDSRAEVQIGSTSIRLGSETSVTFLDLGDSVTQLRLSAGTLFFRIRHVASDDTFEVDTPNLAFNVVQPGEYRIDVNENGDQTTAVVWEGDAEITGGGSSYRLSAGQEGTFSGVDQLQYDVGAIGPEDDFDRWAMARDQREDQIRSAQYVSPEMTGYEDLDEYGRWHNEAGYGAVWTPAGVPNGWAPYRYGHWAYVAPWGWTWVEDEPWGFAPFHYGRWAYLGGGWCWVPGPVAVVPVYSPALVAFVGGGGFSIGVGVGGVGVGWFPLAPGEVYVPWYRTSRRYVERVNVTNTHVTVVNVTNVYNNVTVHHGANITYVNQRQDRGITVVNRETFVNARPVHSNVIRVNAREIQRAPVTHEVVQRIEPTRKSLYGTAHPVRFAPPERVITRPVVVTRQPVVINRTVPVSGMRRAAPPLRMVRPALPSEAEQLHRGARGATPGFQNAPANTGRPGEHVNNREATQPFGGVARPGAPESNNSIRRQGENVPKPGGPQRGVTEPQRGELSPRPSGHSNVAPYAGKPEMTPGNERGNGPENNHVVPPENNRRVREVPRPPSSHTEYQPTPAPQNRVEQAPAGSRESPRNAPEPSRPNYQPTPPPQNRVESAPPPRETRTEPQPQPRHEVAPPPTHNESAPRHSETRSAPAPQHESRAQESRGGKGGNQGSDRGKESKDKGPSKFR